MSAKLNWENILGMSDGQAIVRGREDCTEELDRDFGFCKELKTHVYAHRDGMRRLLLFHYDYYEWVGTKNSKSILVIVQATTDGDLVRLHAMYPVVTRC